MIFGPTVPEALGLASGAFFAQKDLLVLEFDLDTWKHLLQDSFDVLVLRRDRNLAGKVNVGVHIGESVGTTSLDSLPGVP